MRIIVVMAACLLPSIAGASATLHALVEGAWQRSPSARAIVARQEEGAAARALSSAWLGAAPTLGLSGRSGESEASLSAPVLLPAQRAANQRFASRSSEELAALQAQARLDIAGEVRLRYWEAVAAREVLAEKAVQLEGLQALAADVQRRVVAGDMARSDGLLAQQEALAAEAEVALARSRAGEALSRFRLLTGATTLPDLEPEPIPASAPHAGATSTHPATPAGTRAVPDAEPARRMSGGAGVQLPGPRAAPADGPTSDAETHTAARTASRAHGSAPAAGTLLAAGGPADVSSGGVHARLAAARTAEARARAGVELAGAGAQPAPTVGLLLRRERARIDAPNYERSVGLALQIPFGSKSRNRPLEAQAGTQLATASAELAQAEAAIAEDLQLARDALANAQAAERAAQARAAALREHAALIDKAFRHGERPLAELLRAQSLSHEAEVAARRQRVALALAHAQLNQALGIAP